MEANFTGGTSEPLSYDLNEAQDAMDQYCASRREATNCMYAAEMTASTDCEPIMNQVPLLNLAPDVEVQEVAKPAGNKGKEKKKGACHRGLHFKEEEDIIIVSGWLNIAKDAATGTNQNKFSFYKRLHQYYKEAMNFSSPRTQNSIQQRWQTIKWAVSDFHAIFAAIERRKQSGTTEKDMIADAVRIYEQTRPWQFRHCWEILRFEPRWHTQFQEIQGAKQSKKQQEDGPSETQTPTTPNNGDSLDRPEGRDSVKRRRAKQCTEDVSSSPAVEMLQKMHDRDQEMDEKDNKHKEELMTIERTKVELQKKQLDIQIEMNEKKMQFKEKELEENKRLKEMAMETKRFQTEAQIMFTDPATMHPSLRQWIVKKQRDILIKEGLDPSASDGANM